MQTLFIILGKVILNKLIVPAAIKALTKYTNDYSTDNYDDELLSFTKKSVNYFSSKDNNDVSSDISNSLNSRHIR